MDSERRDGAAQSRDVLTRLRAYMDTVLITSELRDLEAHLERQIVVYDLGVWEYAVTTEAPDGQ